MFLKFLDVLLLMRDNRKQVVVLYGRIVVSMSHAINVALSKSAKQYVLNLRIAKSKRVVSRPGDR